MDDPRVLEALVGRQRPLAHLGIGTGRDVDAADRGVVLEPGRRRDGRDPVGVLLQRLEEPLDPASATPAVLPGRRPGPELLAVVAHHPDAIAGLGRVVAEVGDHLVDLAERDAIAKALLGPEDGDEPTLVLRGVGAPEGLLGDGRGTEVRVIEDGPSIARRHE
jgi:hypothetical protein